MRAEIEQAMSLLQQGRPDALDRALALLQNTVFSFSMKVCGHREDAEDTMQDVLLKSVRYLPEFDSPNALVVWLYKVARNRCLMSRRRSKFAPKEHLSLEELMPDREELETLGSGDSQTPEESLLEAESGERLRAAVLRVPAAYRLILVLHDMEELSTEEVARITGLREGTVRVRLHRARLFLRKELAKRANSSRRLPHSAHPTQLSTPHHSKAERTREKARAQCKQMFAQLSDYLDGALDPTMCDKLERHIGGCAPCEAFLGSLRTSIEQARRYQAQPPDATTAAAMRASLADAYRQAIEALPKARTKASSR